MLGIATVTSKSVVTIPMRLQQRYGLKEGTRVVFVESKAGPLLVPVPSVADLFGIDREHKETLIRAVRDLKRASLRLLRVGHAKIRYGVNGAQAHTGVTTFLPSPSIGQPNWCDRGSSLISSSKAPKYVDHSLGESLKITDKEYERYRGRHVAIVRGRVLGAGGSSKEALEELGAGSLS